MYFQKPKETPFNIISLGAGVQSSTMLLMAAHGEIGPVPDAAVFADTQAEPASVYKWLEFLENAMMDVPHPIPIYRVTKGSLTDEALRPRVTEDGRKYCKTLIPFHTKNQDGSRGMTTRTCTFDFKITPLLKFARDYAGIKRGQKEITVTQWIGISCDEIRRMKLARDKWAQHRWPLVEMGMHRYHCLLWMERHGYPLPPRSACVYCPFHGNAEWRRLKEQEPKEFERAVRFEKDIVAALAATDNFNSIPFLHPSLVPLDQVDFSTDSERGQGELWGNECEGMCGV
jgi:hypothetical protein